MDSSKNVLNYLQNVLGVKSLPTVIAEPTHWKVAFVSDQQLSPQESDLVQKIASAMHLESHDWLLVHEKWAKQLHQIEKSEFIVCFSSELFKNLNLNFPQLKLFEIPSPRQMLAEPGLKKQAWDVLRDLVPKAST